MPIQINRGTVFPTPEHTRHVMQQETDSFGTFFNLDRVLYHEARYQRIAVTNYPEFRAMAGSSTVSVTRKQEIRNIMMERFGIPDFKLADKHGTPSLKQEVIELLQKDPTLSEDARHFVDLYSTISAASYMASYLVQYANLPLSAAEDCDNQRMVIAHPTWNLLATSRLSASVPSLQNIKRDICDIYTSPKGWTMVFSDSGQIEPRITYSAYIRDELIVALIKLYDDAYYGLLHFILMTPEEEAAARADLESLTCMEISDEMKNKRARLKVLGLAGNYGSANLSSIDSELGPLYDRKIVNHPARKALEAQVTSDVHHGVDCFYGYFGTPVRPDNTVKYERGSSGWSGHLIRCGINNPIQTTAAELMNISIQEAKKVLGPLDHIGAYKHDEGMFYVQDDFVEERAPKLRECLSYAVEGWIPIGSDLHIGRKESPHVTSLF